MQSYIEIGVWQLALASLLIVFSGILSMRYKLGLEKDLAMGTVRTFVQLGIMGYVLKLIFGLEAGLLVLGVFFMQTWFAARIVKGRVKETSISFFKPTFVAVQTSFMLVTFCVTAFIIGVTPWWDPQFFIPIGGMVAGNSMNALALSLDRFFTDLRRQRPEVEMRLCLGATATEATEGVFRDALRTGMIPSINSMMGVGIVSIPGMMTGQILAGADPTSAVRYQIVVMLMIVASTTLASFIVLFLVRKKCFSKAQALLLSR